MVMDMVETKIVRLGKEAYVGLAWESDWLLGTSPVMVSSKEAKRLALQDLEERK